MQQLAEHREAVEGKLKAHLDSSRDQLINHFLPIVMSTPPQALQGQVVGMPTEHQARAWLVEEFEHVFPEAADLVAEMKLDVQSRDVTYETLTDENFGVVLRSKFRLVDWDRPFKEFDAARAREKPKEARKGSAA
jgi:hypothetical protein